ncbi:hypothetical protein N1029_15835 [Herbiconiux sp. CPCC 203406]|uniref:hypothetical protein n=1 Tax=Herbiconiux oxytropis TaxID=2970915 RepID=UPI00217DEC64|nr:hypothetical protein [Herbiconiux oxytropis]MCS5723470.1 hypothetical protein [Herbiconiux oxytropis]
MLTPSGGELLFLFSDLVPGKLHGYEFDGWDSDEYRVYYYTGEGPTGRQQFVRRNKILLDSRETRRNVHLFIAVATVEGSQTRIHEYIGQFELDSENPFRREPPEELDDERSVIVFKLIRLASAAPVLAEKSRALAPKPVESSGARVVGREVAAAGEFLRQGTDDIIARRREREFEDQVIGWIERRGTPAARLEIRIAGQSGRLLTDTWVESDRELFEAKASPTRNAVRMAVAQLLDYRRHIDPAPARLTVIVPAPPTDDLIDFAVSVGVGVAVFENDQMRRLSLPPDPAS